MSKKLRIAIIEDEPISSAYLKNLISQTGIEHKIIQELDSVSEALEFFTKNPDLDLIFMDIHLGDGTCFDILNTITIEKPIIFCTTFDTYAVQAFKYNSIDYILKPAKLTDIEAALKKYWSFKKSDEDDYLIRMDKMMGAFIAPNYKKRFLVRKNNKLMLIDINSIICFYSDGGTSYLMEKSGSSHTIDFTLEKLEELIDPNSFFRINRKMMISINEIHSVEDYFNNRLKIRLHSRVPLDLVVSRNRVKHFKNWLKGVS
ncbi:LytR/AlgR family response regulator transcription factor [Croceitalea rosinachiae]|uniref:LytTR family DNA-binding domain-containing protein n=1 Tax=Croceitalea rosinachiae TaxID=3075596 RepID=A0ABU3ADX9_9FLAO|nr:LytTR family DNA-binding domain-containing protein [Croceitalea sp. F388]MDT0608000.1 LytTR family DNA-binding domain-containing protein [Croceitalea sp. F388]